MQKYIYRLHTASLTHFFFVVECQLHQPMELEPSIPAPRSLGLRLYNHIGPQSQYTIHQCDVALGTAQHNHQQSSHYTCRISVLRHTKTSKFRTPHQMCQPHNNSSLFLHTLAESYLLLLWNNKRPSHPA